jgi:hypothetical protein
MFSHSFARIIFGGAGVWQMNSMVNVMGTSLAITAALWIVLIISGIVRAKRRVL